MYCELFQDEDGLWRWRLHGRGFPRALNGWRWAESVIAVSGEGYTQRLGAQRAWERAKFAFANAASVSASHPPV